MPMWHKLNLGAAATTFFMCDDALVTLCVKHMKRVPADILVRIPVHVTVNDAPITGWLGRGGSGAQGH